MEEKVHISIPCILPTDYFLSESQEGIGYEPYGNYIGFMRDVMEKSFSDENSI